MSITIVGESVFSDSVEIATCKRINNGDLTYDVVILFANYGFNMKATYFVDEFKVKDVRIDIFMHYISGVQTSVEFMFSNIISMTENKMRRYFKIFNIKDVIVSSIVEVIPVLKLLQDINLQVTKLEEELSLI
jgi:predicted component of type VI protein secretion system